MKRLLIVLLTVLAAAAPLEAAAPYPAPANLRELRAVYELDGGAEAMLNRNGFVVLDHVTRPNLQSAYPADPMPEERIYVTSDAVLQLWYGLHQRLTRELERQVLYPETRAAVASVCRRIQALRSKAGDSVTRAALRDGAVLLHVADRLLESGSPIPPDLKRGVDPLITAALEHRNTGAYPEEDFTQYRARGHYAGNPDLERYFRGTMWLTRRMMAVDPTPREGDRPLRMAVGLAAALREAPDGRARFRKVHALRTGLMGEANSLSIEQLLAALERVHGTKWELSRALRPTALHRLRSELKRRTYPRARVWTRTMPPGTEFPRQLAALVPDFAVPDSAMFQASVHPKIPNRSLPTGLEVAAALGLPAARAQIGAVDPAARQVLSVVDRYQEVRLDDGNSVYRGWLSALSALARSDYRSPEYMRTDAWERKTVSTTLASWAQLRHNTVLYAAQTHAGALGGSFEVPRALVEPVPVFYARMAMLAERTGDLLAPAGPRMAGLRNRVLAFRTECRFLQACARATLLGKLTRRQSERLAGFGQIAAQSQDDSAPVIADVATGLHGEVLHVGAGRLNAMIVIPDRSAKVGYVGWVSSYYEVVRPNRDRLTDGGWRAMQGDPHSRPERPEWTHDFVYLRRDATYRSRQPLREAEQLFGVGDVEGALDVLRRIIAAQPYDRLAAEAQFRVGRHYAEQEQWEAALMELHRCLRMYGCAARSAALDLAGEIEWRRRFETDPEWQLQNAEREREFVRQQQEAQRGNPQQRLHLKQARALVEAYFTGKSVRWEQLQPPVRYFLESEAPGLLTFYKEIGQAAPEVFAAYGKASGLAKGSRKAEAAAAFEAVQKRWPSAELAPYALWHAAQLREEAHQPAAARTARDLLAATYPLSVPLLPVRLQSALNRDDRAGVASLITECEKEALRLGYYRTLLFPDDQLRGGASAAKRTLGLLEVMDVLRTRTGISVARPQFPEFAEEGAFVDRLLRQYPQHGPQICATLLKSSLSGRAAERLLLDYPDHPDADLAWDQAWGEFPGCLDWLVPAVNRGPVYAHYRTAERRLRSYLSWDDPLPENREIHLRFLQETAREVRQRARGGRAAVAADLFLAKSLIAAERPEEALDLLNGIRSRITPGDPLQELDSLLHRRAKLEVGAKRRPEWIPSWSARLHRGPRPSEERRQENRPRPAVGCGMVFAPVPGDRGWDTVVALDEATGAERWRTRLEPLKAMAFGDPGSLFCVTRSGRLAVISARTGKQLYAVAAFEEGLFPTPEVQEAEIAIEGVTDPGTGRVRRIVLVSSPFRGLTAVEAADGKILWRQTHKGVSESFRIAAGHVVRWGSGNVWGRDLITGRKVWSAAAPQMLRAAPQVVGHELMLVGSTEIRILSANDGREVRRILPGQEGWTFGELLPGSLPMVSMLSRSHRDRGYFTLPDLRPAPDPSTKMEDFEGEAVSHGVPARGRGAEARDRLSGALLAHWWEVRDLELRQGVLGRHFYVASGDGRIWALPRLDQQPAGN